MSINVEKNYYLFRVIYWLSLILLISLFSMIAFVDLNNELFVDRVSTCISIVFVIIALFVVGNIYFDIQQRKHIVYENKKVASNIHQAMISASNHILNNFLNQVQMVKIEAERSQDFDKRYIQIYSDAFEESIDLINRLSSINEITSEAIEESVYSK